MTTFPGHRARRAAGRPIPRGRVSPATSPWRLHSPPGPAPPGPAGRLTYFLQTFQKLGKLSVVEGAIPRSRGL